MSQFWSEITEHFQSALQKAETLGKEDLTSLSAIPEIQSYLNQLSDEDMIRLIDHAQKITSRKNPDFKPVNPASFSTPAKLKDEDEKIFNKMQAGLRLEFPKQIIETLKKLDVRNLTGNGYGRLNSGMPTRK